MARPPVPLERDILKTILDWLACIQVFAWRANTGAVAASYKGKSRFMRFGPKGQADIIGVLPKSGTFLAIEVKRPGQQASDDQEVFLNRIREQGGIAFVAHCREEAEQKLRDWLSIRDLRWWF